ncbi:MAG: amidohydrolase/deacetylase family metallohydrolase [Chloroflexi bacterium]|nr:amidohydrolase/deacetylase family metallohydrolase [Chloroflexota bacterium]MDA1218086.1 amidohydrolase/deacetylase family metallohydrolase [Chloroflexota bacterium]PKB57916.1 MAG: dihydroorotase [SAR202 cluster bacterium Casp-Chloro-G3]
MTSVPPIYELLLKGGTLLDPGQGIHDRRDVAFQDGKIAAVAERIDPTSAQNVVDVAGKLVTPGLIDLHGHFYHGGTGSAVHADRNCLSAGVTTGVDAGSSGCMNYGAMRDYVFPAHKTRLLAFIHIGSVGLAANRVLGGGLHDLRIIDVDRTIDAIKSNPGFFFGVKVRMHHDAVARWDAHTAMKKARAAADQAGVRLMVHVSGTPIPLPDVLEFLGPGDISTHAFNGDAESILDRNNQIRPEVREAVKRGVVMDVGHAGVHCDVEVVRAAMQQGMNPDTISTDIHVPPEGRTVYLMNDLVSKFHALGMTLEDAVAASTIRPAKVLGLQESLGSLAVGMAGDAAVFDLREGRFVWHDMAGHNVEGKVRLDTFLTVRDGSIVWREGRLTQMGDC